MKVVNFYDRKVFKGRNFYNRKNESSLILKKFTWKFIQSKIYLKSRFLLLVKSLKIEISLIEKFFKVEISLIEKSLKVEISLIEKFSMFRNFLNRKFLKDLNLFN